LDNPKDSLEELRDQYAQAKAEQDRLYWLFTRTARGQPVPASVSRRVYELQERILRALQNRKSMID
jgi:hypothetical protein